MRWQNGGETEELEQPGDTALYERFHERQSESFVFGAEEESRAGVEPTLNSSRGVGQVSRGFCCEPKIYSQDAGSANELYL